MPRLPGNAAPLRTETPPLKLLPTIVVASLLSLSPYNAPAATLPVRMPVTAADARVAQATDTLTISWLVRLNCMPTAGQRRLAVHRSTDTSRQGTHLQLVLCLPLPEITAGRK